LPKLIFLWALAWVVFAVFDVSFDRDVFRAYTAIARSNDQPDDGNPRLLPNAVFEYRLQGDKVIRRVGSIVDALDNCVAFDRDDWSCTYTDGSARFGARQGTYFDEIDPSASLAAWRHFQRTKCFPVLHISFSNAYGMLLVALTLFAVYGFHSPHRLPF